jgi:hypothetical protein
MFSRRRCLAKGIRTKGVVRKQITSIAHAQTGKITLREVRPADQRLVTYVQWYVASNEKRMREIDLCIRRLLANREISHVVLCVPVSDIPSLPQDILTMRKEPGHTSEIQTLEGRLTYDHVMRAAACVNTIYMIVNSDIVVPERAVAQIRELLYRAGPAISVCLTRYESSLAKMADALEDLTASLRKSHSDSQDLWAFRGGQHIQNLPGVNIPLGVPGCDNKIAWALDLKTRTINPSRSIRTYHVHDSAFRTYTEKSRVPKPYKLVPATVL